MGQHNDSLFINVPMSIELDDAPRPAPDDFWNRARRSRPWLGELMELMVEPAQAPEPELPNAERFPTLAATGFVFAEAIDLGPVTKPACACPTCGRLTERIEALT